MGTVVKPFTFADGGIVDDDEHNANYDTLYNLVNGNIEDTDNYRNQNNSVYKTILFGGNTVVEPVLAATYMADLSGGQVPSGGLNSAPAIKYLDDSDFAVTGKTVKLRVRAQAYVNATAPAITITVGLHPVSAAAGGPDVVSYTLGAAVAGSTVAFASPSASSRNQGNSGDFSFPADGHYCFGIALSANVVEDSAVHVVMQLETRNV